MENARIKVVTTINYGKPKLSGDLGRMVWVLSLNEFRGNDKEYYQMMIMLFKQVTVDNYIHVGGSNWWSLGSLGQDGFFLDGAYPINDDPNYRNTGMQFVEDSSGDGRFKIQLASGGELVSHRWYIESTIAKKVREAVRKGL